MAGASRILWLYERVEWLLAHDEIALALDEKPNLQALERSVRPSPCAPGKLSDKSLSINGMGRQLPGLLDLCNGKMRVVVWRKMTVNISVGSFRSARPFLPQRGGCI